MSGCRPLRETPIFAQPRIGAAIDDHPLAPRAHLETQRAGVGMAVESRWWRRARIHEDYRSVRRKTLEARVLRRRVGRMPSRIRPAEHQVDQPVLFLVAVVEQAQPAVSVAQLPQRRAAIRAIAPLYRLRRVDSRVAKHPVEFDQAPQDKELHRRASSDMDPVDSDLGDRFGAQHVEPSWEAARLSRYAHPGQHQRAKRPQPFGSRIEQADHATEMSWTGGSGCRGNGFASSGSSTG